MPTSETPPEPHDRYEPALHHLLELADYERMAGIAAPAAKYDLRRMRELAQRMGDPQTNAPVVHVAGTKGKGSVAAMVTGILRAAGYRVGTFTSPHLHTFRERIRLDGEPASENVFAAALERVWPHIQTMAVESLEGRPTTFEALTAMAFDLFRLEAVDVQVIEVGLGGRLDCTNVVDSAVAVITPLSLDHTAILGETVEAIALEKAGIIKGPAPVIVSPQPAEAMGVVRKTAANAGATLLDVANDVTIVDGAHDLAAQRFAVETTQHRYDVTLPLLGAHQRENAATAIAAVEALGWSVDVSAVERGLSEVRWEGRFQVLSPVPGESRKGPYVVADVAHNPHSMARLCEAVRDHIDPQRTLTVFGCSRDKAAGEMVQILAGAASRAFVSVSRHPRSSDSAHVASLFEAAQVPATTVGSVAEALRLAVSEAGPEDLVLITGSMFVVAEALEAWYDLPGERYAELDPRHSPVV